MDTGVPEPNCSGKNPRATAHPRSQQGFMLREEWCDCFSEPSPHLQGSSGLSPKSDQQWLLMGLYQLSTAA